MIWGLTKNNFTLVSLEGYDLILVTKTSVNESKVTFDPLHFSWGKIKEKLQKAKSQRIAILAGHRHIGIVTLAIQVYVFLLLGNQITQSQKG